MFFQQNTLKGNSKGNERECPCLSGKKIFERIRFFSFTNVASLSMEGAKMREMDEFFEKSKRKNKQT